MTSIGQERPMGRSQIVEEDSGHECFGREACHQDLGPVFHYLAGDGWPYDCCAQRSPTRADLRPGEYG